MVWRSRSEAETVSAENENTSRCGNPLAGKLGTRLLICERTRASGEAYVVRVGLSYAKL